MNAKTTEALKAAQHELTALNGLLAADGAAPNITWPIDTTPVLAKIDEALADVPASDCPGV